jgi:hypothetical protein
VDWTSSSRPYQHAAAWAGAFQYFGAIWTHDPNELLLLTDFSDASNMSTSSEVELLAITKKPPKSPVLSDMEDSIEEEKTGLNKYFSPMDNYAKKKLSPPKLLTDDTGSVATAKATGSSSLQLPKPPAKSLTKTQAKTQAKTLAKTQATTQAQTQAKTKTAKPSSSPIIRLPQNPEQSKTAPVFLHKE